MYEAQPEPVRTPSWTRCARAAWALAILSLPVWAVRVSSGWVTPFGAAGLAAMVCGAGAIVLARRGGGSFGVRLAAMPAMLAGAAAAMKLLTWYEKYS